MIFFFFYQSLHYYINFDVLPLANQIIQSLMYKCAHQPVKKDLFYWLQEPVS